MVIEVDTRPSGIPSNSAAMSSIESMATPTLPTSPPASRWSESYPIWVGRSKATLNPLTPWSSRYLYLAFDSAAVPKPAYCRIVHSRPRYIVGWMPRVNGNSPGLPRSAIA